MQFTVSNNETQWILDFGPDSVVLPGVDITFSPSIFEVFEMEGSTAANPIIVGDEEDKEKSAPTTTTPESERPNEPPRLLRSHPFGPRLANVLESLCKTLFC